MAKTYQWTNDTPLGHMNVELDALWTDADSHLASSDFEVFLSAQVFSNDPGVATPAVWNPTLAGSRLSAWTIPTGATNCFFWHNLPMPKAWSGSGAKVRTTLYYELNTAGAALDKVYVLSSGYAYDSGDLNTSPAVAWNEATNPDISSYAANTIYTQTITEGSATIGSEEFLGVRLNWARSNASYTYANGVYFHGAKLELV